MLSVSAGVSGTVSDGTSGCGFGVSGVGSAGSVGGTSGSVGTSALLLAPG
mgnify:CR=1 FL=1